MKRFSFYRRLIKNIFALGCLLYCLLIQQRALSAINPSKGAVLNYTQVMFEYDEVIGSDHYVITISPINAVNPEEQKQVIIKNTSLAYIVSGLKFGRSYIWYYEAFKNNAVIFKSEDLSFSIRTSYLVDPNLFRTIIDKPLKEASGNEIFFLDYRGIAIDRQGNPVWFYPFNAFDVELDPNFRNLIMTKDGTITMLNDSNCYEFDINGKELWKAPNDGKISGEEKEHYHHDFKKLDDGTYITSSYKYEYEPNFYNNTIISQVRYNTLIQYDAAGKILWHWNEKDHISKEIIFGIYKAEDTIVAGTHLNAFDYSAKEDAFVISCRHNSSIVKIDKKTGRVIYIIGPYDNKKKMQDETPMFLHQHGLAILPDNKLLFYNNNSREDGTRRVSYPKIVILKEPEKGKEAEIVWEFECTSPKYPQGILGKGGYAAPLPNGNILVCMGGANYIFEITPGKEVVWQCSFERLNRANNSWSDFLNYRSSYSSSLHPYYFTLQHANSKKSPIAITINNEGTEDDLYRMDAILDDGVTKVFTRTVAVKRRTSQAVPVPVKKKYSKKSINVFVTRLSGNDDPKFLQFKNSELVKK